MLAPLLLAVSLAAAGSEFEVSGAHDGSYQTEASINFNAAGKVWILRLVTPRAYRMEHGRGYSANLFFSKDFTPAPGRFPVQFRYLGEKDALGGSFIISGEGRNMFSHDTDGFVVFETFDDEISGQFEFTTYDSSKDDRKEVHVEGHFTLPRGDALR